VGGKCCIRSYPGLPDNSIPPIKKEDGTVGSIPGLFLGGRVPVAIGEEPVGGDDNADGETGGKRASSGHDYIQVIVEEGLGTLFVIKTVDGKIVAKVAFTNLRMLRSGGDHAPVIGESDEKILYHTIVLSVVVRPVR
jgi:hypothetical protein